MFIECPSCQLTNQNPLDNECWQCGADLTTGEQPTQEHPTLEMPIYKQFTAVDAISNWPRPEPQSKPSTAKKVWASRQGSLKEAAWLPALPFVCMYTLVAAVWTGEGGSDGRIRVTS